MINSISLSLIKCLVSSVIKAYFHPELKIYLISFPLSNYVYLFLEYNQVYLHAIHYSLHSSHFVNCTHNERDRNWMYATFVQTFIELVVDRSGVYGFGCCHVFSSKTIKYYIIERFSLFFMVFPNYTSILPLVNIISLRLKRRELHWEWCDSLRLKSNQWYQRFCHLSICNGQAACIRIMHFMHKFAEPNAWCGREKWKGIDSNIVHFVATIRW